MSATDELRRMLDERGVEWEGTPGVTYWLDYAAIETEQPNKLLWLSYYTAPEQAIAATLGEADEGCYLMRDGTKFPVELDYGFLGIMPITIKVGGFRYLLEVPDGE